MKLLARLIAIGLLASVSTVPAQGEPKPAPKMDPYVPTGSMLKQKPTQLEGDRLNRYFDDMAKCVVRKAPERADYFMRMSDDYGMAEQVSDVVKFLPLPTCVGEASGENSINSVARFTPTALRNWLSEKLYLAAHRSFTPFDPAVAVPERVYFSRTATLRAQGLGAFSDCLVQQDAAGADALIRTQRGSAEENAAARALVPAMSQCLTSDQTLSLTQELIRGLAAQGLWQRYQAPKAASYKAGSK